MKITFNEYAGCLEFFCSECHRGVLDELEHKYCPYCGHKYSIKETNDIKKEIYELVFSKMNKK